jgi:hypothetical protein
LIDLNNSEDSGKSISQILNLEECVTYLNHL